MKQTILCTVAAFGLLIGPTLAQNAARPAGAAAGGGGQAPAAGGAQAPAAEGGEQRLPEGQPRQGAPAGGARQIPGADKGAASPGMKPTPGEAPEPGQRKQGENVGVPPKAGDAQRKPDAGEARPKAEGEARPNAEGGAQGEQRGANRPARPAPRLSGQQETRVRETFRTINVRPVDVTFNVAVGVAVPRAIELRPVPREIVTYVPEYEGFEFFVAPGRVIIVDPVTLEIVAVLPL